MRERMEAIREMIDSLDVEVCRSEENYRVQEILRRIHQELEYITGHRLAIEPEDSIKKATERAT